MSAFLGMLIVGLALAVMGGAVAGWVAIARMGVMNSEIVILRRQVSFLLAEREKRSGQGESRPQGDRESLAASVPVSEKGREIGKDKEASADIKAVPIAAKTAAVVNEGTAKASPSSTRRAKPRPQLDLETLLGAKGSVWIGGIALLLGAVFLLRYTIEAGLLTPVMRLSLAALLGLVALGASDLFARRDAVSPRLQALTARADIPALLAAVGVFTLFGTVYAAHALYGLLGTLPAFGGLAGVAFGALLLSLRRGPWLAAIGLIGALAVPLLVASVTPSYVGVFAYVALIVATSLFLSRRQGWPWLQAAALAGATAWLWVLSGKAIDGVQFGLWASGLLCISGLTLRALSRADGVLTPESGLRRSWVAAAWLGLFIQSALAMMAGQDLLPWSHALPFVFLAGGVIAIWRGPAMRLWGLIPMTGCLFALLYGADLPVKSDGQSLIALTVTLLYSLSILLVALTTLQQSRRIEAPSWATVLVIIGGLTAFMMGWILPEGLTPPTLAWIQPTGLFALSSLYLVPAWIGATHAVKRGAIWSFAGLWALSIAHLAHIDAETTRISVYAWLAAAGSLAAVPFAARLDDVRSRLAVVVLPLVSGFIARRALDASDVLISTQPLINGLWLFFGLPALVCGIGSAWLARRGRRDLASDLLQVGAIVFAGLLIILLIHHGMNEGDLSADVGFEALAAQLLLPFALLAGASLLKGGELDMPAPLPTGPLNWGPVLLPALALIVSGFSLLAFSLFQLVAFNPLLNGETRIEGPVIFNALLLGYLVPTGLLAFAAFRYSGRRPLWFVRTLAILAGLGWLAWTTAQIRVFAQGPQIDMASVPWANGELYAVSAVWLLTGLALLAAGSLTARRDIRIASAALITLTTLKVFLVDMSALDGALRALSFIGLGVALIGIGRLYQRVLTSGDVRTDRIESLEGDKV